MGRRREEVTDIGKRSHPQTRGRLRTPNAHHGADHLEDVQFRCAMTSSHSWVCIITIDGSMGVDEWS